MKNVISTLAFLTVLLVSNTVFASGERVNINTASAQVLEESLDGVGPKRAQAIVDWRQQNGKFESISDLALVKGIAGSVIEKNKAHIDL